MLKHLFKLSRSIHKYTGLLFLIYFLLMGLSGVLLNHPQLIRGISIPTQLIPTSHTIVNGNRMAVREAIVDRDNLYLAGRAGVWHSDDNGHSFSRLGHGFPASSYDQDTFSLLLDKSHDRLFAGTRSGLYAYSLTAKQWQAIPLGATVNEPVVDILQIKNRLLVFTQHRCYSARLGTENFFFHMESLRFDESNKPQSARLLYFLLKLHDGSVFGLGGRLFVDSIGLTLIFLCASGLFIWILPRRKKNSNTQRGTIFRFKWFYSNHLKIGIYAAAFLTVIVLSGVLIRPPFVKIIDSYHIPLWMLPMEQKGHWQPRIDKAVFEPETETLWLATRQGFFNGRPDFTRPMQKQTIPVPRSGMGTSVFEFLTGQQLLIGSFSGLYLWDPRNHRTHTLQEHKSGITSYNNRYRVTGVIIKNGSPVQVADYHRGVVPLAANDSLQTPPQMTTTPMSLWHFLFEFHNGRIFQQWLGTYTWLLIPLGGFLLFTNLITGTYDWLWHNRRRRYLPGREAHKHLTWIK